jgi:hypothetical protein
MQNGHLVPLKLAGTAVVWNATELDILVCHASAPPIERYNSFVVQDFLPMIRVAMSECLTFILRASKI